MQEVQTLRGYIQALPRIPGKEDNVKASVITEDGTEYRVLHKGAGMDLVDYVSADVEVTGTVSRVWESSGEPVDPDINAADEEGTAFVLIVRSYRLSDEYDDPWYDDDV